MAEPVSCLLDLRLYVLLKRGYPRQRIRAALAVVERVADSHPETRQFFG